MWDFLFTVTIGFILYFLYGSLVFWSVGVTTFILFVVLMFVDVDKIKMKFEREINNLINKLDSALF